MQGATSHQAVNRRTCLPRHTCQSWWRDSEPQDKSRNARFQVLLQAVKQGLHLINYLQLWMYTEAICKTHTCCWGTTKKLTLQAQISDVNQKGAIGWEIRLRTIKPSSSFKDKKSRPFTSTLPAKQKIQSAKSASRQEKWDSLCSCTCLIVAERIQHPLSLQFLSFRSCVFSACPQCVQCLHMSEMTHGLLHMSYVRNIITGVSLAQNEIQYVIAWILPAVFPSLPKPSLAAQHCLPATHQFKVYRALRISLYHIIGSQRRSSTNFNDHNLLCCLHVIHVCT